MSFFDVMKSPLSLIILIVSELQLIAEAYVREYISGRGGSRAAATSKMECFVIIVNGFQPLTIITKHSLLDVTAALYPPLSGNLFSLRFAIISTQRKLDHVNLVICKS